MAESFFPTRVALFFWGCPPAIRRFIVSIGVWISINTCSKRTVAHVCQKVLKRCFPPVAHFDTATAISWKLYVVRVITSIFHGNPTGILSRSDATMLGCPMFCESLKPKASATSMLPGFQVKSCRYGFVPTIAFAYPSPFLEAFVAQSFKD